MQVGSGARVLVIDDEPGLREGLELLLSHSLPRQVGTASSLDKAFSIPQDLRAKIGVIVLDDKLGPGISGFSALPQVHVAFPKAAVVMIGALLELRLIASYHAAGVAFVFSKPWANDALVAAVQGCLDAEAIS